MHSLTIIPGNSHPAQTDGIALNGTLLRWYSFEWKSFNWQNFPLGWPVASASWSLCQTLCPLTFLPYHMCFPEFHDEELDNDEQYEYEEGHKDQQQDTTLLLCQSPILPICFCRENARALDRLRGFFWSLRNIYSICKILWRIIAERKRWGRALPRR